MLHDVLSPGTLLKGGDYRIDYALGRGGFGVTYRALHTLLERVVAIKEYYPQEYAVRDTETGCLITAKDKQDAYQRGLQRFIREGRILSPLRNPHVVQVQDLFEERDTAYLVMELIKGSTLAQEITSLSGIFPEARVEELIGQLVEALSVIHTAGVYHLDLKPDNVMIVSGDRVVLIDFGAARQEYTTPDTRSFTMEYVAPEVVTGEDVGPESDLFSLGMMLHELLVGERPPPALARLTAEGDVWQPELAQPWKNLLQEALHLDKESRPSSVRDWWSHQVSTSVRASSLKKTVFTKCPKCHHDFSISGAGICQCPECQWKFEVNAYGDVIAEKSLLVVCPNCHLEIITEAGLITCSSCDWKFTVDKHGKIIKGIPIKSECPWCGHRFLVNKAGSQRCPNCDWEFEIDRGGLVVRGEPIMVKCPNCSHDFPVKGAGEWECPACGWKFTINRRGTVIDGKPIDVICPVCRHGFRVQRSGRQLCPVCHSEFRVNPTGVVIRVSD